MTNETHDRGPSSASAPLESRVRVTVPKGGTPLIELPLDVVQGLLALVPGAACLSTLDEGRFLVINPRYSRISGYEPSELVGQRAVDLGIWHDPSERRALIDELARSGVVMRMRVGFRTRSGLVLHGFLSARIVAFNGLRCILADFQDFHDEVEAQRKLEESNALLNAACRIATIGPWEFSTESSKSYWSETVYGLHGRDPAAGMPAGDYLETYIPPQWRDRVRDNWRRALRERVSWTIEMQILREDGSRRWVRDTGEPVVAADGRVIALRGVMQDIDAERRSQELQQEANARFQRMFELTPVPMGISRAADGVFLEVNAAWQAWSGFRREDVVGKTATEMEMITPEGRAALGAFIRTAGTVNAHEACYRIRGGEERHVILSMRSVEIGSESCWLFVLHDMTETRQAQREQRERNELLALCAQAADLGVWDLNFVTRTVRGDARWRRHRNIASESPSVPLADLDRTIHRDEIETARQHLQEVIDRPDLPLDVVRRVTAPNGEIRWIRNFGKVVETADDGRPVRLVGITSDITSQYAQQLELERLAHFDNLTGLPNRALLSDRLRQAVAQVDRSPGRLLGICYLDLDGFKPINDRYGHDVGDGVLIQVARRMMDCARATDTVARLGGDEFVILLTDVESRQSAEVVLQRIMDRIAHPYEIGTARVAVTASMGLTLYPEDASDADTLLRHADQAMYLAKQAGRNRVHRFDAIGERARDQHSRELERLRRALADREFVLYVQPKVDMHGGTVVGAEALVRWRHPERGILGPGNFLPQIEGSDLEQAFGEWVIDEGLDILERWRRAGMSLPVSLNVSARHLQSPAFVERVRARLHASRQIDPRLIEIEITESGALSDLDQVAGVVTELSALGIAVALDDFGTGYSSLSYLRRLPVDTLKVDQSFVGGMIEDHGDLAIVQGIIALARSFGRKVIAEGVETVEHGLWLVRMGCLLAQGYGVARPMPADTFVQWVDTWEPPMVWQNTSPGRLAEL